MTDKPIAIVTGAASGIGRATAAYFAKRDHRVALIDISRKGLDDTAAEIARQGGEALAIAADTADSRALAGAVAEVAAKWGKARVAVAAAGIARQGQVTAIAEDEWHRMLAVNLTGVFLLARHAMPHLLETLGAFVAISSDAGVRGAAGFAAYCASKHGVVGLVRCLALDYGPKGVRSNVVCPSFVDTPMADELLSAPGANPRSFYEGRVPLGRFAKPDEVAAAIFHLASDEASYSNGMLYVIDGGNTAGTFGA